MLATLSLVNGTVLNSILLHYTIPYHDYLTCSYPYSHFNHWGSSYISVFFFAHRLLIPPIEHPLPCSNTVQSFSIRSGVPTATHLNYLRKHFGNTIAIKTIKLSRTRDSSDGSSASHKLSYRVSTEALEPEIGPEPCYINAPTASSSEPPSPRPPPFSSLYFPPPAEGVGQVKSFVTEPDSSTLPAFAPALPLERPGHTTTAEEEVKAALPQDTKGESSSKGLDDGEPPPPYTEGSSPLEGFQYVMAAAGGAASIITQVQQGGPPPVNTLGGISDRLLKWRCCWTLIRENVRCWSGREYHTGSAVLSISHDCDFLTKSNWFAEAPDLPFRVTNSWHYPSLSYYRYFLMGFSLKGIWIRSMMEISIQSMCVYQST